MWPKSQLVVGMSHRMDLSSLRILEIGDHDHFKLTLPGQTTLLWTGYKAPRVEGYVDCTPSRLWNAIRNEHYDLIVTYARIRPSWHLTSMARSIRHSPGRPLLGLVRGFGVPMLRLAQSKVPVAVLDMQ